MGKTSFASGGLFGGVIRPVSLYGLEYRGASKEAEGVYTFEMYHFKITAFHK